MVFLTFSIILLINWAAKVSQSGKQIERERGQGEGEEESRGRREEGTFGPCWGCLPEPALCSLLPWKPWGEGEAQRFGIIGP